MWNKICRGFERFVLLLTGGLLLLILGSAFMLVPSAASFLTDIMEYPQYAVWTIAFLLFVLVFLLFSLVDRMSGRQQAVLVGICAGVLLIGQLILWCSLDVIHTTDDYYVQDQALALYCGEIERIDTSSSLGYFSIYGNNYFVVILTLFFCRLGGLLHITDLGRMLGFVNIILIDLSVWFLFRTVRLMKGRNWAVKILILSVLNPLNYIFIYWTYTCTYSLPLMTGVIYLAFQMRNTQETGTVKQMIYGGLFALCCVIGYFLRPTVLIPVIAVVMCFWMTSPKWKVNLKRYAAVALCMVIVAAGSYCGVKKQFQRYFGSQENNFPVTHWLMMGVHDDYDFSFVQYTGSFPTKGEKVEANLQDIRETLKEYGISGTVKHYIQKIPLTWANGAATGPSRMSDIRSGSRLYQWIAGDKSDLLNLYCQAFRILTLLLALVSVYTQFRKHIFDWRFLFTLSLLGGILFYSVWESKSAYSLPFIPFLLVLAVDGTEAMKGSDNRQLCGYLRQGLLVVICVSFLFGVSHYQEFTQIEQTVKDWSIQSDSGEFLGACTGISSGNQVLRQEFYTENVFNRFALRGDVLKDKNCGYQIRLLSGENELASFEVDQNDIRKNWLTLAVDSQYPQGRQKYTIEISAAEPGTEDSVNWRYHTSMAYDDYDGECVIGGEVRPYDMLLRVYEQHSEVYLNQYKYVILFGLLLLGEVILYFFVGYEKINKY